ncbi:MAG: DUF29 domain-containing protein [Snowella sp.]|nr:DUF29 domain-containing protein [Snowella sp.]
MNPLLLSNELQESGYTDDFYQWLEITRQQIENQQFSVVDWQHLLEELEALGNEQKNQLESRLIVLFEHLLKLAYWVQEKDYNQRGWQGTIIEQRKQIKRVLKKNPSLKPYFLEIFEECYQDARDITIVKTGLSNDIFPTAPILTPEQALDESWLPNNVNL